MAEFRALLGINHHVEVALGVEKLLYWQVFHAQMVSLLRGHRRFERLYPEVHRY